jgi:hypothetical protein
MLTSRDARRWLVELTRVTHDPSLAAWIGNTYPNRIEPKCSDKLTNASSTASRTPSPMRTTTLEHDQAMQGLEHLVSFE